MADKAEAATTTEKAATEPVARRHPSRIQKLTEKSDSASVRQAHQDTYGLKVTDQFATDLAAFVAKPGKMPQMLASGDAEQAMAAIRSIYGFSVSREYAADLIAFAQKEATAE